MKTTHLTIQLDEAAHEKIQQIARQKDHSPNWLLKQAVIHYLEQVEKYDLCPATDEPSPSDDESESQAPPHPPFLDFATQILPQTDKRAAITSAWRIAETELIPRLLEQIRIPAELANRTHQLAYSLAEKLRNQHQFHGKSGMVQSLLQEYSLSSTEGVALMCLAEALLRIPDKPTRDALIADKISRGRWRDHLGHSHSIFVNAATWGLILTSRVITARDDEKLSSLLHKIIDKGGIPLIQKAVDQAIRLMGKQFVTGENIADALTHARRREKKGFRYSYDMLGEAALTQHDASAYLLAYQQAIQAIGKAASGRGIYDGPGISIKLSALHPRYSRAHYDRVMEELYPVLKSLTLLARQYDIGINIDAEESERLELSLDLLEKLCAEPALDGWNGIGFVIQAYQKRCPQVIDYLIDLAERSQRRLMIRLVKGAYWDSEIKRAQTEGMTDYPVYTRKIYTDIAYLACARKLLSVPQWIYPQFATHNAHTLAAIYHLAGENYYPGQYEFQCLHGMGEPLYAQVTGPAAAGKLNRPCRIYAPVGHHETLLAYLVRRLLENGANTSFVNRIADASIPLNELIADPVKAAEQLIHGEGRSGLSHPAIPLPAKLYGPNRQNSAGVDLNNEQVLASLSRILMDTAAQSWKAAPIIDAVVKPQDTHPVINPANSTDIVGQVQEATEDEITQALAATRHGAAQWSAIPPAERARRLTKAADQMETQMLQLIGLLVREAGKTFNNAIAEIREAIDFLRYYSGQIQADFSNETHIPLGPVLCISPWNFPLAIFTGQIAAALAAGNSVLAKPAEQTPLIAAAAVQLLLDAGIPPAALQLLPGRGEVVGARLAADRRVCGILFTGSTAVATILQRCCAERLTPHGAPVPLIAETGGVNAMIVDSSALTEQVVTDIIASAFDSAGQRCSALRLLCLQEDIADNTLKMLRGAMAQYRVSNPEYLATDMGPVIDDEAYKTITHYIENKRLRGAPVYQAAYHNYHDRTSRAQGYFVLPTLIELNAVDELDKEIFGPVLHVIRYSHAALPELLKQINASGYGLTLGVHTRIEATVNLVTQHAKVGNVYINRNMVGAVVGVQPFGGEGLSGTGPKAGGPLYLYRLLARHPLPAVRATLDRLAILPASNDPRPVTQSTAFQALTLWASEQPGLAALCQQLTEDGQSSTVRQLPAPAGERNTYTLLPRERILCLADNDPDALTQLAVVTSIGSTVLWPDDELHRQLYPTLPPEVQTRITFTVNPLTDNTPFDAVIYHGDAEQLQRVCTAVAKRKGAIITVQGFNRGDTALSSERLFIERTISVNTAAAGGDTHLMTIE